MSLLLACVSGTPPVSPPPDLAASFSALYADPTDADALEVLRDKVEDIGYRLDALSESDLGDRPHPDRDLDDALGGANAGPSPHALDSHLAFILLPDQSVVNPDQYEQFDRTFLEGGECFADGSCDSLRTWNDIVKVAAFGVKIPYAYEKAYVRVGDAIVARGWVEEESLSADDQNGILQSYNLDVFWPTDDGGTRRVQAQWAEMKISIGVEPSDDFLYDQIVDGLVDVFEDTDAAIAALAL